MNPRLALVLVVPAVIACKGAAPPVGAASVGLSNGSEGAPPGTFAVSGLRGTLTQQEIDAALQPKLPRMLACIQQRRVELEALAGSLALAFHVATDGRVVAVHPRDSTLGDRAAERCILEVASAVRFPPPHGGEADFGWPIEVDPDDEVRAPVTLPAERAEPVLQRQASDLRARCGGGPMVVTMYVRPDGSVASAGAAAPDGATDPELDCIADGVREWRLGSPGSYLGKLSVALP